MNIATKTLATIMLVAILTLNATGVAAMTTETRPRQREGRHLERLYRHHDRKLELRASVLGISADELKEKLQTQTFDQIIKQAGFKNRQAFHTAVVGKMKGELRNRGWSDHRIDEFVKKRLDRYAKSTPAH